MSSNEGKLYGSVVDGVIAESRLDFEDSGIDEATLQELKQVWQERLSGFGIAKMPWDPELIDPVVAPARAAAATAAVAYRNGPELNVKREDTFHDPSAAAMRAAAHIQKMAEENKGAMPGVDQSVRGIMSKIEPQAGVANTNSANANNGQSRGGLVLPGAPQLTQTDGPLGELPLSRQQVDNLILQKIQTTDRAVLEPPDTKLEINITVDASSRILQVDGAADAGDEEINSDLDDSEDELNSGAEDEEDEGGMIMLCLYDKVQRVKNKWKYILKDGVANINGKDYVFSKGSGESEW